MRLDHFQDGYGSEAEDLEEEQESGGHCFFFKKAYFVAIISVNSPPSHWGQSQGSVCGVWSLQAGGPEFTP